MKKITTPLFVGLVAVGGIVAFIWAFGAVKKQIVTKDNSYLLHCYVDSAIGIALRSRVTMSGVQIGQIESITLDPKQPNQAKITMRVAEQYKLHEGVRTKRGEWVGGAAVFKRQASLIGDSYIDITPGSQGEFLKDGGQIHIVNTKTGMEGLLKRFEKVGDNIEVFTRSLAQVYGGKAGTARLNEITENVRLTTRRINALAAQLQTTVGGVNRFVDRGLNANTAALKKIVDNMVRTSANLERITRENQRAIRQTLRNIAQITRDNKNGLKSVVGNMVSITSRIDRLIARNDKTIDKTLANLNANLKQLRSTLRNTASITKKINESKDNNLGRLVNDDKLVKSIEGTVDEVGNFIKTITRLQTHVGYRAEYNILQNGVKNYIGVRLQPKEDKYYLIELVTDPRGKTSYSSKVTKTTDPKESPIIKEDITETTDSFKFNVQFAKRWRFMTGRFGIFENTGGLGLDFNFFNDHLRFTFEIFDFGRDRSPRIKTRMDVTLWKYIFLSGGVDDIANKRFRDYFVGGGFIFTDDDLKAILTVAPRP